MSLAPDHRTWSESDRAVPRVIVRPLQRVLAHEAAGGVVMLATTALALLWANSPWSAQYFDLWSTPVVVEVGSVLHLDHLDLRAWVNDALMTLFFLLVGVEIKREAVHGELRNPKAVALPVIAALGGMAVPALIYLTLNAGSAGSDGWAIPMATDIAFAVGIVSVLGRRVPPAAKLFLLTLAVADDIGAILVIAAFYTDQISVGWLACALAGFAVIGAMKRARVAALAPYLAVGAFMWLAMLESGVHATLTGVALGLLTPAWPLRSARTYPERMRRRLDAIERARYERSSGPDPVTHEHFDETEDELAHIARETTLATSPLSRLERALSPWVAYVIVPTFALANAGVALTADGIRGLASDRVSLGVALGLLVGKSIGIFGATMATVRLRIATLPAGSGTRHMLGLSLVAGVGFTVALFVATLSFDTMVLTDSAKIGILLGSLVSGTAGYLALRSAD